MVKKFFNIDKIFSKNWDKSVEDRTSLCFFKLNFTLIFIFKLFIQELEYFETYLAWSLTKFGYFVLYLVIFILSKCFDEVISDFHRYRLKQIKISDLKSRIINEEKLLEQLQTPIKPKSQNRPKSAQKPVLKSGSHKPISKTEARSLSEKKNNNKKVCNINLFSFNLKLN